MYYNFLYKLKFKLESNSRSNLKYYHLFPSASTFQDTQMMSIKKSSGLFLRNIQQKDGSRFKVISSRWEQADTLKKLEGSVDEKCVILPEEVLSVENLKEQISLLQIRVKEEGVPFLYLAINSHRFIGSMRVFLILADLEYNIFYSLDPLWPEKTPEDDLGLLVKSAEELNDFEIDGLGVPTVISYQAKRRICTECGKAYDVTRPAKQVNWQNQSKKVRKTS